MSVVRLDWVFALDAFNFCTSHVRAFFHASVLFIFLFWTCVLFLFSLSLSLSLSLSVWINLSMAPKQRKSTLTRYPLRGSRSSSSDPPIPYHIRFYDEKAKTDLFENFQNRGVHLECQVILSDFSDTALPEVIWTRGWESLYGKPDRCPVVFIQEFYSNMHSIDTFMPCFVTTFWGIRIVVTPDLISKVLHVQCILTPWLWSSTDCVRSWAYLSLLWDSFYMGW